VHQRWPQAAYGAIDAYQGAEHQFRERNMRSAFRSALLFGVSAALVIGLFACSKQANPNDPSQLAQYNNQQGQYGQTQGAAGTQGQYTQPQGAYTGQPAATTTAPVAATPAGGFPCQTDNDPQCVFGHCLNGRCGACASATDCKAGSSCIQTPLGMACMPGMGGH
jgi:hypothetical protein